MGADHDACYAYLDVLQGSAVEFTHRLVSSGEEYLPFLRVIGKWLYFICQPAHAKKRSCL